MTSPHIEMVTENTLRMLASEFADFRSAENMLYVMGQMTAPEATQEVERVVTPHEKLRGAFRRVKDGLHAIHALQDAEKHLLPLAARSSSAPPRLSQLGASASTPRRCPLRWT